MDELMKGTPTAFREHCPMDQKTFALLCEHVKDSKLLNESMNVYIEEMITTCLYIIGIGHQIEVYKVASGI